MIFLFDTPNKTQSKRKETCFSGEVSRFSVSAMYLGFKPTLLLTFFQSILRVTMEFRYVGYFSFAHLVSLRCAALSNALPRTANPASNALAAATAMSAASWRADLLENTAADPRTIYPCARTTFFAAASGLPPMRMTFWSVLWRRVRREGRVLRRKRSLSCLGCGFEMRLLRGFF